MAIESEESPSSQAAALVSAATADGTDGRDTSATSCPSSLTSTVAVASIDVNVKINNRLPTNHPPSSQNKILPFHNNRIISQSSDIHGHDNFPMGCAFSPDGTCILTATASDGKFRLYDTPYQHLNDDTSDQDDAHDGGSNVQDGENDGPSGGISTSCPQHAENEAGNNSTYSHNENYHPPNNNTRNQQNNGQQQCRRPAHPWKASLTSHQGGPPPSSSSASYAWYPLMTSSSPLTSLYVTCRGYSMPIHLIDAFTSEIRASYRPFNGVDEMEGPTVVEFSPDGRRIYGTGFKSDRTIAVFDTSIPGREGMIARLGKTRRSSDGQKGIPSAMAFPKCSNNIGGGGGGPSNVFAVGTYSPASIYIYDDRMSSCFNPAGTIVLHGGLTVVGHGRAFSRKKRRFGLIDNQDGMEEENMFSSGRVNWFQSRARGGVTQLVWAPPTSNNPYVLFSASRRSNTVLSWDMRALSGKDLTGDSRPICGLQSYARDGDTNQRLEFDLDESGRRMFVGSGSSEGVVKIYDVGSGALESTLDVAQDGGDGLCEKDAVNGVSYFHHGAGAGKYNGLLAVALGSRKYDEESDDEDESRARNAEQCPGFLQLHSLKELGSS
eukprot:CAMPEP_0172307408 /NCGR_PEP_ID=MMETSP1058-20130122/8284_1 /TAXON_ID=83371 /ORGANISM="Detonula confervacea, Strain CCMP 353" /LENGTH=606 /DNA_ID=CAMNT_0013019573 /DNA_START=117 /DNA_END=1937 /DNA_ORIENTATION=-